MLLAFAPHADAGYVYDRQMSGTEINPTITITVDLDSVADLDTQISSNSTHWGIEIRLDDGINPFSYVYPQVCIPVNETHYEWTGLLPEGTYNEMKVSLLGTNDPVNCGVGNSFNEGWSEMYFSEPECTAQGLVYFFGSCSRDKNPLESGAVLISSLIEIPEAPVGGGGTFQSLIDDGDAAYNTVTGESMAATVAWSGDNLVKPFMGSGLAVFYYLRYWILAIIIISIITYFAYRAFPEDRKSSRESRTHRKVEKGIVTRRLTGK